MDNNIPLTFTIPCPVPFAKGHGIFSTRGPNGCFIQYRATTYERDRVKEAAAYLGLDYGAYMRNIVSSVTDQVLAAKAHEQS